jgi:hypothetical protein
VPAWWTGHAYRSKSLSHVDRDADGDNIRAMGYSWLPWSARGRATVRHWKVDYRYRARNVLRTAAGSAVRRGHHHSRRSVVDAHHHAIARNSDLRQE